MKNFNITGKEFVDSWSDLYKNEIICCYVHDDKKTIRRVFRPKDFYESNYSNLTVISYSITAMDNSRLITLHLLSKNHQEKTYDKIEAHAVRITGKEFLTHIWDYDEYDTICCCIVLDNVTTRTLFTPEKFLRSDASNLPMKKIIISPDGNQNTITIYLEGKGE